ncbi:LysR family transcriptional regulator [Bordetella holmesii]|uniref:LysR substrate-binding domain-containing protein n=1 Tax=Bordetella holmesii TaxID=35814 RepID=UPI000C77D17B|nr:LysR substrate-binding domain-containing protein [Bordetella holmesii]AUL20566.1 LysR family transcriptional regulator [Bordetella holmesii]AUL51896.1 LysR family transcriptional regulator [Bordetella holmesii]
MARSLPPLKALRVFEAAARLSSFTAAAQELNITHSAVSQQIRALEDFIGQPLFARAARGVTLLPDAQAYFADVQASLERIAQATATMKQPRELRQLRLYATPSLAMKLLIPGLADFQRLYPEIDVEVTTLGRQFIDRADGSQDLIIRHGAMHKPDFVCQPCLEDSYVPVASPRFIASHRLRRPADFVGHPLLKVRGCLDLWTQWFGLAGVDVPSMLPGPVFDHDFLSMQAASNDLGLALAPWCLLAEDIQVGRLQPIFEALRLPNAGVHALFRPDSPAAPLARLFLDWFARPNKEYA